MKVKSIREIIKKIKNNNHHFNQSENFMNLCSDLESNACYSERKFTQLNLFLALREKRASY